MLGISKFSSIAFAAASMIVLIDHVEVLAVEPFEFVPVDDWVSLHGRDADAVLPHRENIRPRSLVFDACCCRHEHRQGSF